ncbi:MAG TPA: Asp-tRNA(Asn)/Glu-tRNA(Gln) amidotransferase subunit GatA [Kiritimatiellia bacterium]|jgi:aspartyl-tRNA(Asn)/glutamyl-tRNA(Gln) amidotransferase subunit A|nr:Asp-tRNA(Asn)/Glu-tRNA(Gln) amidotransferase subunit GatA [Kiritimatiellia bacterium]MDD4443085.1 Asp-tRNA(Asn)/Glu-tRNA(Gln) amidotransferase subunit GatA [Kiritimatiellia bacterium]HPO37567.1 Asp-tRNA(Asn)/Glu-tRNA(Gln) amidotransferase subunit GatA [Kiritimatiellia bacterium]HQQ92385.1 Asp-tRNA(Asn)/Glu-tRNA(Gln) amidotransferase subunit GatA [Kiritimatiellia bacterium]
MVGAALTLGAAAEGLRKKTFSSVELTQSVLAAIREKDGALNAYLSVDEAGALQQAAAADAARAAGRDGDLLGIPVAVKDLINVAGQPCSCASKMLAGYVAPYDATVSARLRAVGAVFAGRTNMDEFAMGSSTEGSAFKTTRNPCDLTRVPGGSSGGSAAAVAGGEAVAALGTDTGGSIRQPAAFCGCVGLKPSYGRVSRYGVTAYASSLDQVGPLTRTVEDAAVLLQALAGVDPRDGTTLDAPVPDYRASLRDGLKGMRIGLPREYYIDGTDPEVMACVRRTVDACAAAGAEIVEVSLPHTEYAIAAYYIVATAEASANLARFDGVRYGHRTAHPESVFDLYAQSRAEGFGTEVKRRIILGTYVLSSGYYDAYYGRAQKVRTLIRRDFAEAFSRCDVLFTPVAPTAAYRIGEACDDPLKMYLGDVFTVPANLAGLCGLSVPCGRTAAGLPVGLQILGPAFGECAVLRAGHSVETAVRMA